MVLLPVATFVVGLALGWALVAVTESDDSPTDGGTPAAGGSPAPSVSPGASEGDFLLTVPVACESAAENLRTATRLLRESVNSVRDFDPDEVIDALNRLEALDKQTRPMIEDCSAVDLTQAPAPDTSVSPAPSDSAPD